MAYSTKAKVKLRARGTLSPSDDATAYDAVIDEGLEWAQARIDARLAERYPTPFASEPDTPLMIQHIAADYAGYFALTEGFSGGGENTPTLLAQELKKRADEALDSLAEGEAVIALPEGSTADLGVWSNTTSKPGAVAGFDLVNRPQRKADGTMDVPLADVWRR